MGLGMIYIREGSDFSLGPIYHDGTSIFSQLTFTPAVETGETATNGLLIDVDGTVTNGLYIDNDGTMTTGIKIDGATTAGIDLSGSTACVQNIILGGNGRISTGSAAGSACTIDATTSPYGEGMELRYTISDWADTYTLTSAKGMYLRMESTEANASGSVYGAEMYGVANNVNTQYLWGSLVYAYVKGTAAKTLTGVYAFQPEISFDAGSGTNTITDAAVVRAKVTGGVMSDYTVLDGYRLTLGDLDGGSRTYGNGLLFEDDSGMSGTCALTTGININIATTTAIAFGVSAGKIVDAAASISIYGGGTTGDDLILYGSSADTTSLSVLGTTGLSVLGTVTTGLDISTASTSGVSINTSTPTQGILISAACDSHAINISAAQTGAGITIGSTCGTYGLNIAGACANAINVSVAQTSAQGWDVGALLQHGSMSVPIDYGTISASDLVLIESSVSAIATGQWVVGRVNQLTTAGASTGYFLGDYSYLFVNHTVGAAIANYAEIDITATAALNGNVQCYFAELNVDAGTITGAGKISGMTIEVDVESGVTVAQPIYGIEVDMRGIKVDVVGQTAGIKITKADGSNYLDHGLLFSNEFSNTTSVIEMDLSQGNTPVGIRFNAGTAGHVITSALQFVSTTGGTTYFADFAGAADGLPFTKNSTKKESTCSGWISVLDQDGALGYINVWTS